MKRLYTLLALCLASLVAWAQPDVTKAPSMSTESQTHWYYIQFQKGLAVLADQGAGAELLTEKPAEGKDAQLWKLVGKADNFYLESKQGRKIFLKEDGFFEGNAEQSTPLSMYQSANAELPGWEITTENLATQETPQALNQFQGGGAGRRISSWNKGDGGNVLAFIAQSEMTFGGNTPKLPTFSSPNQEVWYYVQFLAGRAVLADQGDGAALLTEVVDGSEKQLWKLVGDANNFELIGKQGRRVHFKPADEEGKPGFFVTSTTESGGLKLIETTHTPSIPAWEITSEPINADQKAMNQNGASGPGRKIGTWYKGDINNPLRFVEPKHMPEAPKFSTEGQEHWYYIRFKEGGAVLAAQGDGEELRTQEFAKTDAQKWKLIGNGAEFRLVSKTGLTVFFSGTRFSAASAPEAGATLTIYPTDHRTLAPAWELSTQTLLQTKKQAMNQFGGSGPDKALGTWKIDDKNNPFVFEPVANDASLTDLTASKLAVFPTPATDLITIEGVQVGTEIHLFSLNGRLVLSTSLEGSNCLNVAHLERGVYLLKAGALSTKVILK